MRFVLATLFATTLFLACRPGGAPQEALPPVDLSDFYAFYQIFHIDTNFQREHIIFPLQGLPANADSLTIAGNDFTWTADTWKWHRPVDFETSEFTRELTPLGEDIVVEMIVHRNGQTGMLRRFAKMDDEWYLIYFADLNRVKR